MGNTIFQEIKEKLSKGEYNFNNLKEWKSMLLILVERTKANVGSYNRETFSDSSKNSLFEHGGRMRAHVK